MLFSVTVVGFRNGAATVKPAEIAARLRHKLSTGRTPFVVRSRIGRRFHFTIGSSLHKLENTEFLSLVLKAMTNADPANKREIPGISTKISWLKIRRATTAIRQAGSILSFGFGVLRFA